MDFVVDVVNQWGSAPRQAAGEQDQEYPGLVALAAAHQVGDGPAAMRLTDQDLTRVADALYPVFTAPTDDAVVAAVNDLLARSAPAPRLGRDWRPALRGMGGPGLSAVPRGLRAHAVSAAHPVGRRPQARSVRRHAMR